MQAAGPRRRRTLALLAALTLSPLALVLPLPAASAGQPVDPCILDPSAPECATTTTAPLEETTSTEEQPPVTDDETPTTAGETATSVERPITTEEIDDVSDLTSTTLSVTTSSNLLVPGDGTEGAESTTTSTTVVGSRVDDGGTSDGTLIALVIGGLVALALLVAFLTWRYWVATRPPALPGA